MNKARIERVLKGIAGVIVVVGSLTTTFGVAYYLTTFIYERTGPNLNLLLRQIIAAFTGLFLLTLVGRVTVSTSKLSDNLLALAALESDSMRFKPQPYRLDRQIRKLILAREPQWTAKNIEMDVAADEVNICADEGLLSQVW